MQEIAELKSKVKMLQTARTNLQQRVTDMEHTKAQASALEEQVGPVGEPRGDALQVHVYEKDLHVRKDREAELESVRVSLSARRNAPPAAGCDET